MAEGSGSYSEGQLVALAAAGDRLAQRALLRASLDGLAAGVPAAECYATAEVFARQAAEHGETDDLLVLLGILFKRASLLWGNDPTRAEGFFNQANELAKRLIEAGDPKAVRALSGALSSAADAGHEQAAVWSNDLMNMIAPEQVATVQ